jgi:hypothetical protein
MKSLCSLVLFLAACGVGNAQQVLKQEPPPPQPPGEKFLVDDGSCGRGKIKARASFEVIAPPGPRGWCPTCRYDCRRRFRFPQS